MAKLLHVFVCQAGDDLAEIRRATSSAEAQTVLRAAHHLKGAAANLALECIRKSAFSLETHVRDHGLPGVESLLDALQAELAALEAAVR